MEEIVMQDDVQLCLEITWLSAQTEESSFESEMALSCIFTELTEFTARSPVAIVPSVISEEVIVFTVPAEISLLAQIWYRRSF